jgi:hypothetical protein
MNTEQIIKALECCNSIGGCKRCPYAIKGKADINGDCGAKMTKDALSLITNQQTEIKRLNVVVGAMKGEIDGLNKDLNRWKDWYASLIEAQKRTVQGKQELIAQIENLAKENKYLRESLADEREHKEDMGERIVVPIDINEQELEKIVAPYVEKMTVDARTIQANTITEICFRFAVHFSTYTENATVKIKHLFRFLDDMKKEMSEGGDTE